MSKPLLEISGLTHVRETNTVLRDLALSTDAKRIGIVGRNGSGKSSLARLLVGLEEPTSGSLRVLGGDVAKDREFALTNVGMIFQNPEQQIIFPSVREELLFGLDNLGFEKPEALERVESILKRFSVSHWIDRLIYTLSQGQKHLVCLMAVLALEPALVVLDEPYAGLDLPTAARMRRLLKELPQHIILVSHNPEEFTDFDEILWLEAGKMYAFGPPEEVLPKFLEAMAERADWDGSEGSRT